ncbi:MAG: hypothetical protein J0I34_07400 [Pseudonocardia sp.]|uniref:hypothetical protein n=1 Tax=Actinomycetes TaxID=1760 RepID=UPI00086C8F7E|nr:MULTISPECIES: hypothetical protein [Actinomycetes]MBN9108593.1 hypothetical protein [Pseudonocardia sp.]ODU27472.1 MAG: hypothetical protein ABS80_03585 [Pseudonocardia sp. SCN 72-51]ODV07766.1 MAG: hypothetical protein ABT15_06735 [Pseudonocardia sp. SCN 73-27]
MPDPHRPCGDPRCPICATTRIPAARIDPPTTPVPAIRPEWLPGHWQPAPPRTNGHDHQLREDETGDGLAPKVAVATCSLAVLVSGAGLYATGDLLWLLGIMPGAVIAASFVVAVVELVRRHR